jgi:plasmid stabilization system protein ParE
MRDLKQIRDFIAVENPSAAVRVAESLLNRAEGLATFPERGGLVRGRPGLRFIVVGPYLIFYRLDDEMSLVRVTRFWHGARDRREIG